MFFLFQSFSFSLKWPGVNFALVRGQVPLVVGSLHHLTPKFLLVLGPNNVLEKHLAPFLDQLLVFLTLSLKNE